MAKLTTAYHKYDPPSENYAEKDTFSVLINKATMIMDCVLVLSLVVSSHATRHAAGIPATHSLLGILPQLWVNQLFLWSENVGLNICEKKNNAFEITHAFI